MTRLPEILQLTQNNYYKLLAIVGASGKKEKILNYLSKSDWQVYNLENEILRLTENVEEKWLAFEAKSILKNWLRSLPDQIIFDNTSILYSPELDYPSPIDAFKYHTRTKTIILFLYGEILGHKLIYAEPGRRDYCEVDLTDIIYAKLEDIDV